VVYLWNMLYACRIGRYTTKHYNGEKELSGIEIVHHRFLIRIKESDRMDWVENDFSSLEDLFFNLAYILTTKRIDKITIEKFEVVLERDSRYFVV